MSYREEAQRLLEAIDAIIDKDNLDLVEAVLNKLSKECDEAWHDFIEEETNDALLVNNIVCKGCNASIQIVRTASNVYVESVKK